MSRSYRRTPIIGWCVCRSEKPWKRKAHRALRRAVRVELARGNWETLPRLRELSDVWTWGKDGRQYIGNHLGQMAVPDYKLMGK